MSASDGGPAFPSIEAPPGYELGPMFQKLVGMSLRDYFAAAALQGMLANPDPPDTVHMPASVLAYQFADAMLAERAK